MLKRHTEEQQHAEVEQQEAVTRATASLSSKCAGLQRQVDDKVEQVRLFQREGWREGERVGGGRGKVEQVRLFEREGMRKGERAGGGRGKVEQVH